MTIHRYAWFVILCMVAGSLANQFLKNKDLSGVINESKQLIEQSREAIISPFHKEDKSFIKIPDGSGVADNRVIILAPETCTSLEKQRAVNLAAALAEQGIPYTEEDSISINFPPNFDPSIIEKIKKELGTAPAVVVNGWIKGDPSTEGVLQKYEETK